jgi:predicted nucleotidyltransferase
MVIYLGIWGNSMQRTEWIQDFAAEKTASSIPEGIVAIYLYGSMITGRVREESDIDIAILPLHNIADEEKLVLIAKIEGIVSKMLKEKGILREVSIVDLRGRFIPLTLQYKIVTEGIRLYERNAAERVEFENALKREYFDFIPYLEYLQERKYGNLRSKV